MNGMQSLATEINPDAPPMVCPCPARLIRVLHVINGEHYSGAERVQDLLAGRLPEFGFEAGLVCLKPGRFPEVYQSRHARLYLAPMRSRWDLRPVRDLVQIVREEGYALLHAHTPRTLLLGAVASRLTGVPLVYHVHSPTWRDSTSRWQNRLNAWAERAAVGRAAALVCVSHSLAEAWRACRPVADRVHVVPNGVPSCTPRPPRAPGQPDWTLGTVALFRPRKGLELLLEALARLRQWGARAQLLAVGEFESEGYRRAIAARVESLGLQGVVEWTGFTAHVHRHLVRMDLFVLPSLFGEGLPMVVLEAMAAGVPVVATRVEGVPEAIRDGLDGLLVPPGDPDALAQALARVMHGEVDWLAVQSRALDRHARLFSDRAMASGVAQVYGKVGWQSVR